MKWWHQTANRKKNIFSASTTQPYSAKYWSFTDEKAKCWQCDQEWLTDAYSFIGLLEFICH
jgi:hypothetical protein